MKKKWKKLYKKLLALTVAAAMLLLLVPGFSDYTQADEGITVTFRLIGCTKSTGKVVLVARGGMKATGYLGAEYVTWIPTKTYSLAQESTVYDLFVKALDEAGLASKGADNDYVSTIYAPDVLGGYALSEKTNGQWSGWMYTVNGKHPDRGLKNWTLNDGDEVIWHYVNDYACEEADDMGGLEEAREFWNAWLKAPDVAPSAPQTEPPTEPPTESPTEAPTEPPTEKPTEPPTEAPTEKPTEPPTEAPTEKPTEPPTEAPTEKPTEPPTEKPTEAPTEKPTEPPTEAPTEKPTEAPTEKPTEPQETLPPETEKPTEPPTEAPTEKPTEPQETLPPETEEPTEPPTEAPTEKPTEPQETLPPETEPPVASDLELSKGKVSLLPGDTYRLAVTLLPVGSTGKVTWSSSNKKVVTVAADGVLTAKEEGTATVTAALANGKKVSCTVTVKGKPAKTVTLNKKKASLKKGKTLTLKVTLTPGNASKKVTWSSSNKKVAKVNKNGKVTARRKGTAVITVKAASGKKATCKITVK